MRHAYTVRHLTRRARRRKNPGTGALLAIVAAAAGGLYLVEHRAPASSAAPAPSPASSIPILGGILNAVSGAVNSVTGSPSAGSQNPAPSTSVCVGQGNKLAQLAAAASWAADRNAGGCSGNPNDCGTLPHYPIGDHLADINALYAQAASGDCSNVSVATVNALVAINNANGGNNSNLPGQSRYVAPL